MVGCQVEAHLEGVGPMTKVRVEPDCICSQVMTGMVRGWLLRVADWM